MPVTKKIMIKRNTLLFLSLTSILFLSACGTVKAPIVKIDDKAVVETIKIPETNSNDQNIVETSSKDQNDTETKTDDNDKVAVLDVPLKDAKITTPVTVTGTAPAFWFFENSFPVQVQDSAGKVLGAGQANPITESLPEGMTPFHAEVEFDKPATPTGTLLLKADNPSGLPENDYSVKIPVTF
jgi:hypothetical protein